MWLLFQSRWFSVASQSLFPFALASLSCFLCCGSGRPTTVWFFVEARFHLRRFLFWHLQCWVARTKASMFRVSRGSLCFVRLICTIDSFCGDLFSNGAGDSRGLDGCNFSFPCLIAALATLSSLVARVLANRQARPTHLCVALQAAWRDVKFKVRAGRYNHKDNLFIF